LTGPAALVEAELHMPGLNLVESSYWNLIYSAGRHNRSPKYWIVLEEPREIEIDAAKKTVKVVEVSRNGKWNIYYGDDSSFLWSHSSRDGLRQEIRSFLRADANADGAFDTTDAFAVLSYLFLTGGRLSCLRSGDANDDGRLNLSDPVVMLRYLYDGAPGIPSPLDSCGEDRTPDGLPCDRHDPCEE
jgi:hypothetical protein